MFDCLFFYSQNTSLTNSYYSSAHHAYSLPAAIFARHCKNNGCYFSAWHPVKNRQHQTRKHSPKSRLTPREITIRKRKSVIELSGASQHRWHFAPDNSLNTQKRYFLKYKHDHAPYFIKIYNKHNYWYQPFNHG